MKRFHVRSSLGKQRSRSRRKILPNPRGEKGGARKSLLAFLAHGAESCTKYDHEKSIFCTVLFRDAIGNDDGSRECIMLFACLLLLSKCPTLYQSDMKSENKIETCQKVRNKILDSNKY